MRVLVAIPVYNEEKYVAKVLDRVLAQTRDVLVIDDGSTDSTPCLLPRWPVEVIRHATNRGYGRSLLDAFRWAAVDGYDWVITMDCDEQHEPESIPAFLDAIGADDADVISGSRYTPDSIAAGAAPANRKAINSTLTREINDRLGLHITDAFCGFKAYRVDAMARLHLDETGYAFPLQFWVQAAAARLRIREIPVSLIYNDPNRTFGGPLDNDAIRLAHYRAVFDRELARCAPHLTAHNAATCGVCCGR
jgi:dolichol-phosphate mannosyltransferase